MRYTDDILDLFSKEEFIRLHKLVSESGVGYISLSKYISRNNRKDDTIRFDYLLNESYFFEFWFEKVNANKQKFYLYNYFPDIPINFEQGEIKIDGIFEILKIWLDRLYSEKQINDEYNKITRKNDFNPEQGIIPDDVLLDNTEFVYLNSKLDQILDRLNNQEEFAIKMSDLQLEAIEDLKNEVIGLKNISEQNTITKKDIKDLATLKILRVGLKYTGDVIVNSACSIVLGSILSSFKVDSTKLIDGVSNYLINAGS